MNWKEEYIKMLGTPKISELKIEAAQSLKIRNLPTHLYKYRPFNDFSTDNLLNDTVWLNIPSDYNDPFEAMEFLDFDKINNALNGQMKEEIISTIVANHPVPENIIELARKSNNPINVIGEYQLKTYDGLDDSKIKGILDVLNNSLKKLVIGRHVEKIKNIQDTMKVCSFCESNQQLLMWSHYADSHKGFCVEYDISQWRPDDKRKRILYPVVYQDYFYDSTEHLISQIENKEFNNLYPLISCATKSKEWEYEQEWRFIFNIGDSFKKQNYPMNCQTKVFLGNRMTESNQKEIIEICKAKNLTAYKAHPSTENYGLEFEQVN
jgi:hypothetical protein